MRSEATQLDVRARARLFKALGDETRLRIVALLSHGELCVCHFEEALGLSQPNASRQLAVLKNAGIVENRREGNWVYYGLAPQADEGCRAQLEMLVRSFAREELLLRDVRELVRIKGPQACP
jgi:ArsR family transcriptional regulator, arsenate/arsenite/antimonite-responsive transcriptional repressor